MKLNILFICGNSLISKIIRLFDGQYSHVCVGLNKNNSIVLEAQTFTKSRIVKNYFTNYDILSIQLTDEQYNTLLNKAIELVDFRYDYMQIFTTALSKLFKHKILNRKSKYICSELVLRLLLDINYITQDEFDKHVNVTPNELYEMLKKKVDVP